MGNNFFQNVGYLESSVINIRARGQAGTSVYTTIPKDPTTAGFTVQNYFCAGYLI
jgi:hypothetical protein